MPKSRLRVVSIVGTRPQFIKAALVSRELRRKHDEILVHTGQHYDDNMSGVFFAELGIAAPDYHLKVGSGMHGAQTGAMMASIEDVLLAKKPDWVIVYGDTNSTLAGALSAAKLHIRIAHIEAGLRSFNRTMPEEINRVLTDHLSSLLLCPSQTAVDNLQAEGILQGVHLVGDVMADALFHAAHCATKASDVLSRWGVTERSYLLATVHRAENVDNKTRLQNIINAFLEIQEPILFPAHPRTLKRIAEFGLDVSKSRIHNLNLIEPLGYLDMVQLMRSARMILTDSGGLQKEAFWLSIPCITLRDETEWVETVQTGWNVLAGADTKSVVNAVRSFVQPATHSPLYGDGRATGKFMSLLESYLDA